MDCLVAFRIMVNSSSMSMTSISAVCRLRTSSTWEVFSEALSAFASDSSSCFWNSSDALDSSNDAFKAISNSSEDSSSCSATEWLTSASDIWRACSKSSLKDSSTAGVSTIDLFKAVSKSTDDSLISAKDAFSAISRACSSAMEDVSGSENMLWKLLGLSPVCTIILKTPSSVS